MEAVMAHISLPSLTGLEMLAIANSEYLSTRLVFFTASVEDRELIVSAAAGAYGVILKDVALETLVQSLRQGPDGQRVLPPLLSDQGVLRPSRVTPRVCFEPLSAQPLS